MSLNIKNERVHALAREAARRTGKTQTAVIEEALEQLLATTGTPGQAAQPSKTERILAVAHEFDRLLTDEDRTSLTTDWLYDDETGLPR